MYASCMCINWSSKIISYKKDCGNKSSINIIILETEWHLSYQENSTVTFYDMAAFRNAILRYNRYTKIVFQPFNSQFSVLVWTKMEKTCFFIPITNVLKLNMWMLKFYLCIIITGLGHYFLIYIQAVVKTQDHIFPSKWLMSVFQFEFSLLEEEV